MSIETKERLVKIGKTIGVGLIGAAVAAGVLIGIYFLKKGGSSSSSSDGGDNS
jgi:UPF0716 family protein affecting phage T7 exclusion